jgi:predicted transcriptional regulator YdeE
MRPIFPRQAQLFAVTILMIFVAPHLSAGNEAAMQPKVVDRSAFTVVGLIARTTNAKEMTPDGVIGKQWMRLMKDNLLTQIPNKADENIVAVYTDYASDENGEYTYVLGARVTSSDKTPEGMGSRAIPAGRYAVYTSEKGPAQNVVPAMWKRVYATPKSTPAGARIYRADYEVYDERARNPQEAVVELYVGVK